MTAVIYWFRRDLRIEDQPGLAMALATGQPVVPVFVIDPAMNPGGQHPATRGVLWRALQALDRDLQDHGSRLVVRRGDGAQVIPALVREVGATAVFAMRKQGLAYTARDERAAHALAELACPFTLTDDDSIVPEDALHTATGKTFSVFTPFSKAWFEWLRQNEPGRVAMDFQRLRLPNELRNLPGTVVEAVTGGAEADRALPSLEISSAAAEQRLAEFTGVQPGGAIDRDAPLFKYHQQRDLVGIDGTSRLSVHLSWGTISPRAVYLAVLAAGRGAEGEGREGCRVWATELAWRDFYHHLLVHAPQAEAGAFQAQYADIDWEGDPAHLEIWQEGRTGYPIVDAGMRQLNQSGWMHNRTRMITASFLVKDLLLNWQLGEQYFMQRLIDFDIASNNGGWQWTASTGTDAQPYFRIFNPTSQGERYDPQGDYVRRWVPELAKVPTTAIHAPWTLSPAERQLVCPDYPLPIVDHAERRPRAIAMFTSARERFQQASK